MQTVNRSGTHARTRAELTDDEFDRLLNSDEPVAPTTSIEPHVEHSVTLEGIISGDPHFPTHLAKVNGRWLDPVDKDDEFNWGYGGSGPHALALAALRELKGIEFAREHAHYLVLWCISRQTQDLPFNVSFLLSDVEREGKPPMRQRHVPAPQPNPTCTCGHPKSMHRSQQHGQESPGIPHFEMPCMFKARQSGECGCANFTSESSTSVADEMDELLAPPSTYDPNGPYVNSGMPEPQRSELQAELVAERAKGIRRRFV